MIWQGRTIGLVVCVVVVAGCSSRSSAPLSNAVKRGGGVYHTVRAGESLYRIGKAYDVPYMELARVNGLKDPSQIRIGQSIFIPGVTRQVPVGTRSPVEGPPSSADMVISQGADGGNGLVWPLTGVINSSFGPRGATFHDGIDISAPEGTPILAIDRGEVAYSDQLRGYGNMIIIRHSGGMMSVYAHNQINLVREGQQVERGAVIARVGSTGRVTGPHLHFEIRKNNAAQDPLRYLPQLCCLPASANLTPSD